MWALSAPLTIYESGFYAQSREKTDLMFTLLVIPVLVGATMTALSQPVSLSIVTHLESYTRARYPDGKPENHAAEGFDYVGGFTARYDL